MNSFIINISCDMSKPHNKENNKFQNKDKIQTHITDDVITDEVIIRLRSHS